MNGNPSRRIGTSIERIESKIDAIPCQPAAIRAGTSAADLKFLQHLQQTSKAGH
jgi:hypothetical protein